MLLNVLSSERSRWLGTLFTIVFGESVDWFFSEYLVSFILLREKILNHHESSQINCDNMTRLITVIEIWSYFNYK